VKLGERQEADAQAQEARRAASLKEVRQVGSGEGGGSSESLSAALDEIVTSGGKRLAEKIAATHPQPAAHVVGGSSNGSPALHSLVGTPLEPLAAKRAKVAAAFTLTLPWTPSAAADAAATPLEQVADDCARAYEAQLPRQVRVRVRVRVRARARVRVRVRVRVIALNPNPNPKPNPNPNPNPT